MNARTVRFAIAGITIASVATAAGILVTRYNAPKRALPATGHSTMAPMDVATNGSVNLTESQIRQYGVTFGLAAVRQLAVEVRTTGVVTFDETKMAQIAPRFGGFVERLYANSTGQQVKRGQPILDIYSPELMAAQQELLLASRLDHDIGTANVPGVTGTRNDLAEASRQRLQLWGVSNTQINQILSTGRVRRTLTLYSPVSGIVAEKKVLQGQAVTPGETLYTIANLSDVWVDAELREIDAASVRAGSSAGLEFTGLEGRIYTARVAYVYPTLQPESRTIRARIVIPNLDGALRPGMYATVRLATPSRYSLTVPSSAILQTGNRNIVFVDMGNGTSPRQLMPHDVEPGRVAGDYTEILSGLEAGQRVVTSAQFLLDSESNLGEVMKSMVGNGGHTGDAVMHTSVMDDKGANLKDLTDTHQTAVPSGTRR